MKLYMFFFSSRRRHTRCALVTGVQTCALPIFAGAQDAAMLPHGNAERVRRLAPLDRFGHPGLGLADQRAQVRERVAAPAAEFRDLFVDQMRRRFLVLGHVRPSYCPVIQPGIAAACFSQLASRRSEEHTLELQSLMRTSYAVYCLQQKT